MIAVGDPHAVAAEIAMVAGMHRLVQVAHEMDEEGERHQPLARRHAAVGEQADVALDLGGDAIAVAAGRG